MAAAAGLELGGHPFPLVSSDGVALAGAGPRTTNGLEFWFPAAVLSHLWHVGKLQARPGHLRAAHRACSGSELDAFLRLLFVIIQLE